MRIISKYKDYYDYLVGIYGVDNKIVLDRRHSSKLSLYNDIVYTIFVCGTYYDFLYIDGTCVYGEDLLNYYKESERTIWLDTRRHVTVDWRIFRCGTVFIEPYQDNNRIEDFPICLYRKTAHSGFQEVMLYPNLTEIGFNKIIDAKTIYLKLTEWLTPKDAEPPIVTDKNKILSHGYDEKSFKNTGNRLKK